jgi:hypothetical protein
LTYQSIKNSSGSQLMHLSSTGEAYDSVSQTNAHSCMEFT